MSEQLTMFPVLEVEADAMAAVFDRVSEIFEADPHGDITDVVSHVALITNKFDPDKAVATCLRLSAIISHVQRHPGDADHYRASHEGKTRFPQALARAAAITPLMHGGTFDVALIRKAALQQIDCGGQA